MRVAVASVGLRGPGLPGWQSAREWIRGGGVPPPEEANPQNAPARTSPELRRASPAAKLALAAADEAVRGWDVDAATPLHGVFASSSGDGPLLTGLLEALAEPTRAISPTQFHNSVHNAASGYWSISRQSRAAATSVAAGDSTFAVGFLRAVLECSTKSRAVLCVVFDSPFLAPLDACRPLEAPFSAAFVLTPDESGGGVPLRVRIVAGDGQTTVRRRELAELHRRNPAARSLPLLERLAGTHEEGVRIALSPGRSILLEVESC